MSGRLPAAAPGAGHIDVTATPGRRALLLLATALGYFLAGRFALHFTTMPEGTAILWLPNAVLLAALLIARPRDVPALAVAGLLAELAADWPAFTLVEALLFGLVNLCEVLLAWALLRRWGFDGRFTSLVDVSRFMLAGPLLGGLLGATLGAAVYTQFRGGETSYLQFLRLWWFGDAIGLMVATPLLLSLALGPPPGPRPHAPKALDALLLALAALALAAVVAARGASLGGMTVSPVLLLPFAIAVAARLSLRWVTATTTLMALAVAVATTLGRGPFALEAPRVAVMHAQEFLLVLCLMTLGLAALLAQLRGHHAAARAANERLAELNRTLEARVQERTARLDALNADLQRLATIDALTGLLNRRVFFERALPAFSRSRRQHDALAVLMIDVDHFKALNDTHGHQAGDAVLCQVARALAAPLRAEDLIARYGGEEFVVLASDADAPAAQALAQRLCDAVAALPPPGDGSAGPGAITVSIGVAALTPADDTLAQLIKRADDALFEAKRTGRNRVQLAPDGGLAAVG